jgi:hypothetical protein
MKSVRRKLTTKKGGRKGRKTRRGGLFNPFKRKPTPEQIAAQQAQAAAEEAERQRMMEVEAQRQEMARAHFAERDKQKIKEAGKELLAAAEKGERVPPARQRYLREFNRYVSPVVVNNEFDWPASIEIYKKMAETGEMPSA